MGEHSPSGSETFCSLSQPYVALQTFCFSVIVFSPIGLEEGEAGEALKASVSLIVFLDEFILIEKRVN